MLVQIQPLTSTRYSSMVERMSVEHDTVVRFHLSGPFRDKQMDLHMLAGKSGPTKSVRFYHTNKNLSNFDPMISYYVDIVYDSGAEPGIYVFPYGPQNGYYEIGYTVIEIVAHPLESGAIDSAADSDSEG